MIKTLGKDGFVATGSEIGYVRAMAIRSGIGLYLKTGIWPNTHWSPRNMLAVASRITGQDLGKRGTREALTQAHNCLTHWLQANDGGV